MRPKMYAFNPVCFSPGPSEVSASVRYNRRRPTCPDASVAVYMPTPPPSRHRKSHSLGNKSVSITKDSKCMLT